MTICKNCGHSRDMHDYTYPDSDFTQRCRMFCKCEKFEQQQ